MVFVGQLWHSELLTRVRLPIDDQLRMSPSHRNQPAEFFVVATELFFERPVLAREHDPELYSSLVQC